jgi:hypothetical protein
LRQQLNQGEKDESVLTQDEDESETTTTTTGYWSTLIKEQKALMDRLDHLVGVSQKHAADEQEPYGQFKNTLLDLKEVLNRPEYNFSTYTPYSMYGSTFANRSNTGFDDTAVQGVKSEIRSFKGMLLSRRNFPTAQIKPLPPVTSSTTTSTMATPKDNKDEKDTNVTSATTTHSYHPRQRQNSYRAELQAKAKTTESTTTTTTTDQQPTMENLSQPNTGDKVSAEAKGKSTVIEDITETKNN